MGSLQDALPESISPELEAALLRLIAQKMTGPTTMYVNAVRAVAEASSPEQARELVESYKWARRREHFAANPPHDDSLRAFCREMEAGCRGTHEWEKLEDTDTRQAYRFTRCAWAEIFRALGAEDIGLWICEGDDPMAKLWNPRINFERTKTLMEGDDCCDHVFYVEEEG